MQALGNRFGSLDRPPYVRLSGDDRTGAVIDGEWLHINGSRWSDIAEVLVFAFIYDGVPNWNATDGIVTLHVQGQEIETHLTDGNPQHSMCAIARLINDGGSIRVERINRTFPATATWTAPSVGVSSGQQGGNSGRTKSAHLPSELKFTLQFVPRQTGPIR